MKYKIWLTLDEIEKVKKIIPSIKYQIEIPKNSRYSPYQYEYYLTHRKQISKYAKKYRERKKKEKAKESKKKTNKKLKFKESASKNIKKIMKKKGR